MASRSLPFSCRAEGSRANSILTGRWVAAVTVRAKAPSSGHKAPISSTEDRPWWVSDMRRKLVAFVKRRGRQFDAVEAIARSRTFWCTPVTKSTTRTRRSPPLRRQTVQTPSREAVREIMAPAGRDRQRLPPTVAVFHILNEASNDRRHRRIRGAAVHVPARRESVQMGDGAGRCNGQTLLVGLARPASPAPPNQ